MRAVGWGIAALALMAGAASAEAQPPKSKGMPDNWWGGLFGSKPKEEAKGTAAPTPEQREREMERLLKAFQRRESVCLRLTAVAQETNDEGLMAEADRLYDLACSLYSRQSRSLGLAAAAAAPERPAAEEPYELPRPRRDRDGPTPPRMRGGMTSGISEPSRSWEGDR